MQSNPRIPYRLHHEGPLLDPPDGRPLLVHVVVNLEHWAFDQPMPRLIMPPPQGRAAVPDIPNFSWSEYGNRCGSRRLLHILGERQLPVTASVNASVIDIYPQLAKAVLDAGWEFIGHGIHQRAVSAESDEGAHIETALKKIEGFIGRRPRGWLGPGLSETFDTPDLLKAAGVDFVCEWVVDDLPTWMTTKHGPMIAIPYNLELNDSVVFAVEKHSSNEMLNRVRDTVATFEREIDRYGEPRVLTLPLHPHLSGVPHRTGYLEKILDMLLARDDTTFMSGSQIADWFTSRTGTPVV